MNKLLKLSAIATAIAFAGAAHADPAETKGGIKIKTEDGRFEATVGGRIHFDAYVFDNDNVPAVAANAFGSQTGNQELGGFAFRRTYLTLTGKLYGWKYKFEHDFTAEGGSATSTTTCSSLAATPGTPACTTATTLSNTGASGFREMWVSTNLGSGELVLGQFKPYRGMEELTSSNEITMLERPWTTATGIFAGRQFLMGVGYKGLIGDNIGFGIDAMGLGASNTTTEGSSFGGRVYYAPMQTEGNILHLGLSYNVDDRDTGSATPSPAAPYAGRRGPSLALGTAGAAAGTSTDNAQTTVGLEVGYSFGPVTLQAEYATAKLDNTHLEAGAQADSDVTTGYLQASWFVTGEKTVYKKDRGAFGKPKPISDSGAWEVVARYDMAENKDQTLTQAACGFTGSKCEANTLTLGANWYVNPNVRFMLNYYQGEANRGAATAGADERKDEPKAMTLRTQLSF